MFGQEKKKYRGLSPKSPRVQTKKEEKPWIESEVALCSDRKRGEIVNCVRKCPVFGQEKRENLEFCPNPPHVRAGEEEKPWIVSESPRVQTKEEEKPWIVSEVALYWDRKRGEIVNCVRSCPVFGQKKRGNRELCPKLPYVRTREEEKPWIESEVAPSSDKRRGKPWIESEVAPIRTREEEKPWIESEVALCSDRKRGEIVNCVRSCPVFGQEKRKNRGLCPKSPYVRTEKEGKS
ncbi:hypothetical protein NX029_10400 [Cytobacillus firmus]|nr:hypothetical protein [Cytobacillus firmus]